MSTFSNCYSARHQPLPPLASLDLACLQSACLLLLPPLGCCFFSTRDCLTIDNLQPSTFTSSPHPTDRHLLPGPTDRLDPTTASSDPARLLQAAPSTTLSHLRDTIIIQPPFGLVRIRRPCLTAPDSSPPKKPTHALAVSRDTRSSRLVLAWLRC